MIGFAAAIIVGAFVGNSASTIVTRASFIMVPCWIVGWVIGRLTQQTVDDHLHRYVNDHPIPDEQAELERADQSPGAPEHAVSPS